jgi:carbamoyltransferase
MKNEEQYILGISAFFHDSAAVLLKGNQLMAAVQEERFSRKKLDASFPAKSIEYCLSFLPPNKKLDYVAFYENPILKMDRIFSNSLKNVPRGAPIWPQTLTTTNVLSNKLPQLLLNLQNDPKKIIFSNHHMSHAASAYYPSGFDEAAILVVDGVGEWSTTSIFHGVGDEIKGIKEIKFPHSLGLLYSAFTQYCGFKVNSGEYKLMGLAPFGNPRFEKLIYENLIEVKDDGSFQLNLKYFNYMTDNSTINPLFGQLFGCQARHSTEPITQHYRDVAASAQAVTNKVMKALANTALRITGSKKLCLAGGVALNCVANSQIANSFGSKENLWIQPAAGDAGGALGAALSAGKKSLGIGKVEMNPFLGPEYSDAHIKKTLDDLGVVYRYISDENEFLKMIVTALYNEHIVGFFQDRMEFGPRALGCRSILANPKVNGMLQKVNNKIKFRESWRPFAPAILEDETPNYFESIVKSPYMLLTSKIKEEFRKNTEVNQSHMPGESLYKILNQSYSTFPAITHCDYSSRLQTVNQSNGKFYRLLKSFFEKTGCPMLLNTSFNVRGEPIVCTPKDAVDCFFNTHLDVLAIGNFYIEKSAQNTNLKSKINKMKFDED